MYYVGSFSVVDILKDILNKIKVCCMINTKQLNVAMEKWNKSLNEQQNTLFENVMLFWIYMSWNTEERLMLFILLLREGPEQIKLS